MQKFTITLIAAAAGIALAMPVAPAEARSRGTAASAVKAKPSPSRSAYSKKKIKRKPTHLRTAAEVINPAAAARYNAYKSSKTRRAPVANARPGILTRFGMRIAAFFRRGPAAGTTAASASRMRPGVVSVVLPKLRRDASGNIIT